MNNPSLDIIPKGDGAFPEMLTAKKIHHIQHAKMSGLAAGMKSGKTSVAMLFMLEDGSVVFYECSLRLMQTALQLIDQANKP